MLNNEARKVTVQMEAQEALCFDSDVLVLRDIGPSYVHSLLSDYDSRFNSSSDDINPTTQDCLLVHRTQSVAVGYALGCFLSGEKKWIQLCVF